MSVRARECVDSLPQPVFEADLAGRLVFANRAAFAAFGYSEGDLRPGPLVQEMLAPEERTRSQERLARLARGELLGPTEYVALRKDGTRFPVLISSVPIVEEGRTVGTRGVIVDLTDLRAAEASLRIKERAMASALVGIAIAGTDGLVTYVNPAFLTMWGLVRPEQALGVHAYRFWDDVDSARAAHAALREGGAWSGRLVARRADGTRFEADVAASTIRGEGGEPLAMVASVLDVSASVRSERTLAIRSRQQAAVAALGEAALASRDLDALLHEAAVQTAHVLDVEMAKVLELRPDEEAFVLRAGVGWKKGRVGSARVAAGAESQAGYTLQSKHPVIVEDLADEARFSAPSLLRDHGASSGMSVVIASGNRPWGVLGIHSRRPRQFSPDDAAFLQSIANVIAAAVDRTDVERALQHRLALESLLARISRDLMGAAPDKIDDAITRALRGVAETAGVDRCYLFQLTPERDQISNTHEWCGEGVSAWSHALQNLPTSRFPWSMRRLAHLETVLIPDVRQLPAEAGAEREEFEREGNRSVLLVPVASAGILQGFVGFDTVRAQKVWPKGDVRILQTLAELIAAALDRRRQILALRDSEERFRLAFEHAPVGMALVATDERLLQVNKALGRMLGRSREELLGRTVADITHPDDWAAEVEQKRQAQAEGRSAFAMAKRYIHADGHTVWGRLHVSHIAREDGSPRYFIGQVEDVTERRQTEAQLALQASLLDAANDAIYLLEVDGTILYANDAAARVDGYPKEELLRMNIREIDTPESSATAERRIERLKQRGEAVFEVEHRRKDGDRVPVEVQARLVEIEGKQRVLAVNRDLRERRRAEAALRDSEHKLKMLIESSDDIIVVQDLAGRYVYYNARPQYGIRSEDMIGRTPLEVHEPETAAEIVRRVETVGRTGRSLSTETRLNWAGRTLWFNDLTYPILDDAGAASAVATISRNITERKAREEELRKLSAAVEQSPVAVIITDEQGTIEYVNPRFVEMTGFSREEARGQKPSLVKSPATPSAIHEEMWTTVLSGRVWRGEIENRRKSGEPFRAMLTIAPLRGEDGRLTHLLGIEEDVTERRQLEQHLQSAQRLEAVGTLAGGIAHDFNNILAIILGHATLLERRREEPEHFARSLRAVTEAAERGRGVVSAILAFARHAETHFEGVDLNREVVETVKLLAETFPQTVELWPDLEPHLPLLVADRTQLHQVLVNLCVNARDAILDAGGVGRISVRTRTAAGHAVRSRIPEADEDAYIEISVVDTGTGMEATTLRRIFEPFFTTKEKGRGTGLGLAVVYGLVKSLRGLTHVDSAPGLGTTFTVYVPLPRAESRHIGDGKAPADGNTEGNETILVVEDESALRELARDVLESKGYRVLTAADGQEALRVFASSESTIGLVLSDLGLPRLGGGELIHALKDRRPELKAILTTGHLEPDATERLTCGVSEVLLKPYRVSDLLASVRRVLDAR